MAGAFGEDGLEAHIVDQLADTVGVDELGVAESGRGLAEIMLDGGAVLEYLVPELRL